MLRAVALMIIGLAVAPGAARATEQGSRPMRVYVGTYTAETGADRSLGIYLFEFDPADGTLTPKALAAEAQNPSYLAIAPDGEHLYAVNEMVRGQREGAVTAFEIDPESGRLSMMGQVPSAGAAPCYIALDREGRNALVANYTSGSVAVLEVYRAGMLGPPIDIEQHAGSGPNAGRQEGPHAHSINLDPAGRFAVAADLGIDRLLVYRYDGEAHSLTPNDPPGVAVEPGSGPRHLDFHPDGKHAYVINEMASTLTAFDYDPEAGVLSTIATVSTLPEGFEGDNTTADVHVHPSGKFLYGSNRGHDSIAIFRLDPATGVPEPIGHEPTGGKTPRNFAIDPTGRYLLAANQQSGTIFVFRIDPETGGLERVGSAEVPAPVCIKFAPATD